MVNSSMQTTIIMLLEHIVVALGTEFKVFLPQIIPQMLKVFLHDSTPGRIITAKVGDINLFHLNLRIIAIIY